MSKLTFEVPNIGCAGCVQAIKLELSDLAGVASVNGDVGTREIQVEFEAACHARNDRRDAEGNRLPASILTRAVIIFAEAQS